MLFRWDGVSQLWIEINIKIIVILDDGKQLIVDVDSKTNDDIIKHLIQVIGKSEETLEAEAISREKKDNPANFGVGCHRGCMCEIPDQVSCPGVVPLPFNMRGKYKYASKD